MAGDGSRDGTCTHVHVSHDRELSWVAFWEIGSATPRRPTNSTHVINARAGPKITEISPRASPACEKRDKLTGSQRLPQVCLTCPSGPYRMTSPASRTLRSAVTKSLFYNQGQPCVPRSPPHAPLSCKALRTELCLLPTLSSSSLRKFLPPPARQGHPYPALLTPFLQRRTRGLV